MTLNNEIWMCSRHKRIVSINFREPISKDEFSHLTNLHMKCPWYNINVINRSKIRSGNRGTSSST